MTATVFDTLSYAKRLKAAGFSEAQAEAQAEALAEAVGGALVTKQHFDEAIAASRRDLADATTTSKRDLADAVQKLSGAIELSRRDLEARMTVGEGRTNLLQWMAGFHIAISVTILFKVFA